MDRKTKILLAAAGATLAMLGAAPHLVQADANQTLRLAPEMRSVALLGDGTALDLTTHDAQDRGVTLSTEDSFGCATRATLVPTGDRLEIHVEKGPYLRAPWCDPAVTLSVPEGIDLTIGLDKMAASITGSYGDVDIRTGQSLLDFDGSAAHFHMQGHRAALRLTLPHDMPRDAVELDVSSALSQVRFTGS